MITITSQDPKLHLNESILELPLSPNSTGIEDMSTKPLQFHYCNNYRLLTNERYGWLCNMRHHGKKMESPEALLRIHNCASCNVAVHDYCLAELGLALKFSDNGKKKKAKVWECPLCKNPGHIAIRITRYRYK